MFIFKRRRWIFMGLFAALGALISSTVYAQVQETNKVRQLIDTVVSVSINGHQVIPSVPVVEVPGLGFAIALSDWESLKLHAAKPWLAVRGEVDYVILDRVKGLAVTYNPRTLAIALQADLKLFNHTAVQVYNESGPRTQAAGYGGYLNYDLNGYGNKDTRQLGASFEAVGFTPFGSLVHTQVLNRFSGTAPLGIAQDVRLSTHYQFDQPDKTWRLRLGDSIASAGSWGRGVNYGGIKFGTDFSLNPNLVTLPLLQANGAASVPSTVELFVNGTLQRRIDVPAGTFSLDQIPSVTGNGNARLVIRDQYGKEQIIEQPFYRAPTQLRPGLLDYSVDIGAQRRSFGIISNDYGDWVAAGTLRAGLTNWLTAEGRVEANRANLKNAGLGAVVALGAGHTFAPSAQFSQSALGEGWGAQAAYSYTGQMLRLAARYEQYSDKYQQLGFAANELPVVSRSFLSAGLRLGFGSDVGVFLTDSTPRGLLAQRLRLASVSMSQRLSRDWIMSATFSRTLPVGTQLANNSLNVALNYTASENTIVSASSALAQGNGSRNDYHALRLSQRAPVDGGLGVDLEVGSRESGRARAEYLSRTGLVATELTKFPTDSTVAVRVSAQGSIASVDGSLNMARRIDDSFVLVKAPEAPGETVVRGGRRYKLDENGQAVVERVQAYQQTRVGVEAKDLPLELQIGRGEERVSVPAKAGVVLNMQLRRALPVSFVLKAPKGLARPGTKVTFGSKQVLVGLDGLVYIDNINDFVTSGNALRGRYSDGTTDCHFELPKPEGTTIIDMGEIQCS
jgi:outer membrane usher protein